jgi:DnaJ-class molecular chaperone
MKTPKEIADELEAQRKLEAAGYRWVRCDRCDGAGRYRGLYECRRCDGRGGYYEAPMERGAAQNRRATMNDAAKCSLCGEEPHTLAACPACLDTENTRKLLLATRKALAGLLQKCEDGTSSELHLTEQFRDAKQVLMFRSN